MRFADRAQAGRLLGERLIAWRAEHPLVIGIPRGGVPVAAEVARALGAPLDVIVVGRLRAPAEPELVMGAVSEGGVRLVNHGVVHALAAPHDQIDAIAAREEARVAQWARELRGSRSPRNVAGRKVLLVDDGLSTGATARAAVRVLRARGAGHIVVAVPVGSPEAIEAVAPEVDEVICLAPPRPLVSIADWYTDFSSVSDADVRRLLTWAAEGDRRGRPGVSVIETNRRTEMYSHIVVPLDGSRLSERALLPAAELARRFGSTITLVRVVSTHAGAVEGKTYLHETANRLGTPVGDLRVMVGVDPAVEIGQMVGDHPASLVCMGSHGRSGIGEALLGSVADDVVRAATAPVVLVGPHSRESPPTFEQLVVCLDGSPYSEAILPLAASWATALGMKLWLVSAVEPDDAQQLAPDETRPRTGGRMLESDYVQALVTGLDVEANWDVLHGEKAATAIVAYTATASTSLVAMTTHGRTGLARAAIGGTAARVVHGSACPVLVVRPAGLADV